jgi:hypothetical protein
MKLLKSQNILINSLKIFGFFPMNFPGKYKKFKNHLYNLVVSSVLATTFAILGVRQLKATLQNTTEQNSNVAFLAALTEILSAIVCFVAIKLFLLLNEVRIKKYFKKLQDLEVSMERLFPRNKKIHQVIGNLKRSTCHQAAALLVYVIVLLFGYYHCGVIDDIFVYAVNTLLYLTFNCFFILILIFLKMNMNFAKYLQSHLNQVLVNHQKFNLYYNIEHFIKIHRKIKSFLEALNEAFGFVFFLTTLAIFGNIVSEVYVSSLTLVQSNFDIPLAAFGNIVLNLIWVIFNYYFFCQFVFECDKMEEKISRFTEILLDIDDKEVSF